MNERGTLTSMQGRASVEKEATCISGGRFGGSGAVERDYHLVYIWPDNQSLNVSPMLYHEIQSFSLSC